MGAVLFLLYLYKPLDYRSTQTISGLMPIPIVLFGLAWIEIGIVRLSSTRERNRPQMAL